jgi:hypothetical protein
MLSRRRFVGGVGAALLSGIAGCAALQRTSGFVSRKEISVGVPSQSGQTVDVTAAVLTYEPEQRLVTGEYSPEILPKRIENGVMSVSDAVHERLRDQFEHVEYYTNIVPTDGSQPANGLLSRTDFNALSIGGSATVKPSIELGMSIDFQVENAAPPEKPPDEIVVEQYT